MPSNHGTSNRKIEHVNISLKQNVQFKMKTTGFEEMKLDEMEVEYLTLPEIDAKKIETKRAF